MKQEERRAKKRLEDLPSNLSVFSELVLGLSSVALHYLGEIPYDGKPEGGEVSLQHHRASGEESDSSEPCHLELARKNIDYLDTLSEKTRGNLSSLERDLLDHVLSDLRERYEAKAKTFRASVP